MNGSHRCYVGLLLSLLCSATIAAPHAGVQKEGGKPSTSSGRRADVSGDWKITGTKREDPDPRELAMSLKQQEDTFTGTLTTNAGRFEIKDGKVKGSEITFSILIPQQSITAACSGSVDGDTLKASCKMPGGTIDLAGTRQKKSEK
jgi:hypothetical protein